MKERIALIGFGEAGLTFASAARWADQASAYDIDPTRRAAMAEAQIMGAPDAAAALMGASLVLSLVTADQAVAACEEYAPFLEPNALWCDMNSISPEAKRRAARAVERAGARYVDIAVLAPVQPARLNVPLLLSGIAASDARIELMALGFNNVRVVGEDIGRAASIKMIRSVMVKGMEALTDEMMAAARAADVVDEVLASLDASERILPWIERVTYSLERMAAHGGRRAAEMEESERTLASLGVEPLMTAATVVRQRNAAIAFPADECAA